MEDITPNADREGFSRRDMLRRSALVGGALVWTVPAVQTLATPAFATGSGTTNENICRHKFFVKYDIPSTKPATATEPAVFSPGGFSGGNGTGADGNGNSTCNLLQCAGSDIVTFTPTVVATVDGGASQATINKGGVPIGTVSASAVTDNCVTLSFTNLGTGCSVDEGSSFFIYKDGNDAGSTSGSGCESADGGGLVGSVNTDNNPSTDVYRICGGSAAGQGLSHINLCVCVKCGAAPAA